MRITLFTSNQCRHIYFINELSKISNNLNVVLESRTVFTGKKSSYYKKNILIEEYFKNVSKAENKLFGNQVIKSKGNINILPLELGDLKNVRIENLKDFLKSDIYIVFGSSLIKGKLLNFLLNKKAINIHMGVSPYYRGTDCNFWALYDNKPEYVGATVHLLSKGIDSGPILYHCLSSKTKYGTFYYTMSTVKSAIKSVIKNIKNKKLLNLKANKQDKKLLIRYSKKTF